MASIGNDAIGRKRVLFVAADGKRRTIRLGKCSKREAEMMKLRIENLNSANIQGREPSRDDAAWVDRLGDKLRKKLEVAGLIKPRERASVPTVAEWIEGYIASRGDVKPSTLITYSNARRNLSEFFGHDVKVNDVTPQDARDFRVWLLSPKSEGGEGLAENTVRKRCSIASQFFLAARRKRLIGENPFVGVPCSVRSNEVRSFYVTPALSKAVLDACPDHEWRLVFGLARWGGLRCPSEILRLKWEDILWDKDRFWIHAAKTEHHENAGLREAPIFPELRGLLEEAFEQACEGATYVIASHRYSCLNYRTGFRKILKRAGIEPWPKLFQNLRSTRETELIKEYGIKAACCWIGNSPQVALKHYAQVTDEDFEKAVRSGTESGTATSRRHSQSVAEASPGRPYPKLGK